MTTLCDLKTKKRKNWKFLGRDREACRTKQFNLVVWSVLLRLNGYIWAHQEFATSLFENKLCCFQDALPGPVLVTWAEEFKLKLSLLFLAGFIVPHRRRWIIQKQQVQGFLFSVYLFCHVSSTKGLTLGKWRSTFTNDLLQFAASFTTSSFSCSLKISINFSIKEFVFSQHRSMLEFLMIGAECASTLDQLQKLLRGSEESFFCLFHKFRQQSATLSALFWSSRSVLFSIRLCLTVSPCKMSSPTKSTTIEDLHQKSSGNCSSILTLRV